MESALDTQYDVLALDPNERNYWCVDGQYKIYMDAMMMNDKMVMNYLVTIEQRVLIWSLHVVPDVHSLFTRHKLELVARSLGS